MNILMVGNSFSVDAMEYLWQILTDQGEENVVLGNLYIGGCSLQTHVENIRADVPAYEYFTNTDGNWQMQPQYRLSQAVQSWQWDVITVQQASHFSGLPEQYTPWLAELLEYLQTACPHARILWHMTWAYQQDSDHWAFGTYGGEQTRMYRAIVDTVQSVVLKNKGITGVIPCGTTIQNARTSCLSDTLTRDGFHLSIPVGRYMAGLTVARTLLQRPLRTPAWLPQPMDADTRAVAVEAVENAAKNPFAVTQSQYR